MRPAVVASASAAATTKCGHCRRRTDGRTKGRTDHDEAHVDARFRGAAAATTTTAYARLSPPRLSVSVQRKLSVAADGGGDDDFFQRTAAAAAALVRVRVIAGAAATHSGVGIESSPALASLSFSLATGGGRGSSSPLSYSTKRAEIDSTHRRKEGRKTRKGEEEPAAAHASKQAGFLLSVRGLSITTIHHHVVSVPSGERRTDERTSGWTDGRTDGRTSGLSVGRTALATSVHRSAPRFHGLSLCHHPPSSVIKATLPSSIILNCI